MSDDCSSEDEIALSSDEEVWEPEDDLPSDFDEEDTPETSINLPIQDGVTDWTGEEEAPEDVNVWEDNWDDDNIDDDFSKQLRAELEKQGKNADGSEPMKT